MCGVMSSYVGLTYMRQTIRAVVCSSSVLLYVPRDSRDFGDGEPKTATFTFTQLLSSGRAVVGDDLGLNVLRCRADILATTFEGVP